MTVRKIRAGRVTTVTMDQFVGDVGTLFYNENTGEMRVSNGVDPGGNIVSYVLPIASNVVLGGIKLGTGFAIDANGVASVIGGGGIGSIGATGATGIQGNVGPAGASSNIAVYDEGNLVVSSMSSINFVGAIVTANASDSNVTVTLSGNVSGGAAGDRLISGNAEVVLNTSGPEPYILFPAASTGEQLQLAQAEISSVSGNLALTSAEDAYVITNGSGAAPGGAKNWTFGTDGNLLLPQTDMNSSPAPTSLPGITWTDGTFQSGRTIVVPQSQSMKFEFTSFMSESSNVQINSNGLKSSIQNIILESSNGNYFSFEGLDKRITFSDSYGFINFGTETRNQTGHFNDIEIKSYGDGTNGNVYIAAGGNPTNNRWSFQQNGNIRFPDGTEQSSAFSDRLKSGSNQLLLSSGGGQPYVLFPAATNNSQLQISEAELSSLAGNLALTSAEDAYVITNGSGAAPGGAKNWKFDRGGNLTLPNNAVIKDTATNSISFGLRAGDSGQGNLTVAIGSQAGEINQGLQSTAVGSYAGNYNQGIGTVAIGTNAGALNQGLRAVAIGGLAGAQNQGEYAVALGNFAGGTNQPNNSIIINASGVALNGSASGLFIDPIREDTGNIAKVVYYNISTKELTYADLGAAATVDITNTNGLTTTYYPTFVENRTSGQTIRADVDLTYRSDDNLLRSGNIQVGRNIYGSYLAGMSNAIQFRPNIDIDKRFLFTVDSISGTYIRSGMEMPVAEVDKAVTLGFPHTNGTVSYIYNQGADTNGTEWNDALVIFQNGGNVKIGTITGGGTKIWNFTTTGNIVFPDSTVQTTAWNRSAATVQSTPPASPVTGQLYYDTDDGRTYIYTGSAWIDANPAGGGGSAALDEAFGNLTAATGVVTHDCTTNRLFYHTSMSANFTANFTNLNLSAGRSTSISLVLVQGGTARMVTAVQIGGVAQTITWQGSASAPAGNANRTDAVTFSILNVGGTYTVLGMMTSFGGV